MLWVPKRRFVRRIMDNSPNTMLPRFHIVLVNLLCGCFLPSLAFVFYLFGTITFATFKVFTFICFVVFVIVPLIFKFTYKLQNAVVFLNFVHNPVNADYDHPHKYGLEGVRNIYVTTEEDIKLGVWQILPENVIQHNGSDNQHFENALANAQNVIIYHHGNAGNRLTAHRIEIYKILRQHFHVITFDYRSYGDSSNVLPSEEGIVRDCMYIYKWVSNKTAANIFVWGHSLGTSLAIHALSLMQNKGVRKPTGIILEAPFNNMREEISENPLARLFSGLPWFHYTVVEPMQENGFSFQTDKYICGVDAPIIILHAEDDRVVPIKLGLKLYADAMLCRKDSQGSITFHEFDGSHSYGHKFICRSPDLHDIIRDFVSHAIKETKEKRLDEM